MSCRRFDKLQNKLRAAVKAVTNDELSKSFAAADEDDDVGKYFKNAPAEECEINKSKRRRLVFRRRRCSDG